jgi:hypothetical protein
MNTDKKRMNTDKPKSVFVLMAPGTQVHSHRFHPRSSVTIRVHPCSKGLISNGALNADPTP